MTTPSPLVSPPARVLVRRARAEEAADVAWLAALTFPLACPPGTPVATMAAHVAAHLRPEDFRAWIASDHHAVLVAVDVGSGRLLGYALVAFGEPDGQAERDTLRDAAGPAPYAELSKIYVRPAAMGSGVSGLLLDHAVRAAERLASDAGVAPRLWLGTNGQNARAQAFYRKHGFEVAGTRTKDVGGVAHDDIVMLRRS